MTKLQNMDVVTDSRHRELTALSDEAFRWVLSTEEIAENALEHITNCPECADRLTRMDSELARHEYQQLSEDQRNSLNKLSERLSARFSKRA